MEAVRLVLRDDQWARMEPHCLGKPSDPGRTGGDNRLFLEAVLWIARTGSPWRDLPAVFGKWNTVFKRYRDWVKADIFQRLFDAASEALNPTFGKLPLNAITVGDINRWIGKQSSALKPSSVLRHFAVFKAIMNDAVRNGLIDRNPADNANKIRGVEPRQRFVTEAEWQRIVETAERIEAEQDANKERVPQQIRGWLRHFVVWAYNSGMRRAEILALKWPNVRPMDGKPTQIEVINTKTAKPRHVTCTAEMEAILLELRKLERAPDDQRLFPVSMMTLKRSLARLWAETGLPDVQLHDLRRTHATILMQENIDPKAIAGRLGHSGLSMLGRHYAVDRGDAEAARRFAERGAEGTPESAAKPSSEVALDDALKLPAATED